MNYFVLFALTVCIAGSGCKPGVIKPNKEGKIATLQYFGDTITVKDAQPIEAAIKQMASNAKMQTKIEGIVNEVCMVKGCWMTLNVNDTQMIRVTFKDYGFFMPKDIAGKTVICQGELYNDTTSVDMLKHYAEDAGESIDVINAITEPEIAKSFEAVGVILK